jgi:hypothetical protein
MKLKKLVAGAMITAGALLALTLLVGLLVPTSVLSKLDKRGTAAQIAIGNNPQDFTTQQSGSQSIDPVTGQPSDSGQPGSAATPTPGATPPASSGSPTGGGSSGSGGTGGSGGGTTAPTVSKPVVSIGASPASITSGNSTTVTWSATNSPSSCSASGAWSGSKGASGSAVFSPTTTSTYTLTCTNAGGSASASATVTVTAAPLACGQGGTCHLSDIQSHNTAGNCRSAINATGTGTSAYAITSSFLTLHQSQKSITSILCGKVYSSNLKNFTSSHSGGSTLGGSNYQTWINNFYIGPYN